ncbi:MAG: DEAD/DEAH box helicase [Candidatus Andersenbacteria bacterium]
MSHNNSSAGLNFSGLGLSPKLLAVLARLKFTVPTPIQQQAIPLAVAGKDVIGIAQTGTGKTLAFALPLLQQIARTKKRGLIILPTRELAMQVAELFQSVGHSFGLRQTLLIGGASMHKQLGEIRHSPHVVIGTPGRIIDHLDHGSLNLSDVGMLILDEADRMLDMGFTPQIKRILQNVPRERQTMLFSATMPPAIAKITAAYMKLPVKVEVALAGTVAERVNQEIFIVTKEHKNRLLDTLLDTYTGTVLVFSRTKYGAKKICRAVRSMNHTTAEIHSNLSLSQRKRSLAGFKSGAYRVLVATDIAARGIDVTNIELVINYDLPDNLDDYVHRVGRTGRAGRAGQAISFITPDQRGKIRLIERLVREPLRVSPLPKLLADRPPTSSAYRTHEQQLSAAHRRTTFHYTDRVRQTKDQPRAQRRSQRRHRTARVHI